MADMACYGYAASDWWTGVDISGMPHLRQWLETVGALPSCQASLMVPGGKANYQFTADGAAQRAAIEQNAKAAGRPHFGWRDLAEVSGRKGGGSFAKDSRL